MRGLHPLIAPFLVLAASSANAERIQSGGGEACELISSMEVQQAGEMAVAEVRGSSPGPASRCSFAIQHGGRVELVLRRNPDPAWISGQIDRMGAGVRLGTYREEPAIGARAFLRDEPGGHYLCVFGSGYYLQISLYKVESGGRARAILTGLAKAAVRSADSRRCR